MARFSSSLIMVCILLWFNSSVEAGETPDTQFGETEVVTFAGGCFWCVEADFDHLDGVLKTISGYSGGTLLEPTYKQVAAGNTGHLESVQIFYNPETLTFQDLLDTFWHSIDPTDTDGQFCDRGSPYRTAIFTHTQKFREFWDLKISSITCIRLFVVLSKRFVTTNQTFTRGDMVKIIS